MHALYLHVPPRLLHGEYQTARLLVPLGLPWFALSDIWNFLSESDLLAKFVHARGNLTLGVVNRNTLYVQGDINYIE